MRVEVVTSSLEEREQMFVKTPYVSDELIDYLNQNFGIHYCTKVMKDIKNASEAVGVIKGMREVIDHLEVLNTESKESR